MKLKIKVKLNKSFLHLSQHGDWVDLKVATTTKVDPTNKSMIDLGIAIALPKGYEAYLLPRSSTFKNTGLIQTNSMGIIDNAYCGNDDIWKFPAYLLTGNKPVEILEGTRVAQFRVQLTQQASVWTKLKWLFTSGIDFVYVDELSTKSRGGFGSTGK